MFKRWIDTERLIHSVKTLIACLIGVLLTKLIEFRADQWIVITIVVVMCAQIYVGSVIQKAYSRFLGTLIGCIFAIITITSVGTTDLSIALTLGLSSFIFSYIATSQENLSYAGTLGAATTAIIMLGQEPTVTVAAERFLEISVGILIATLVSQFVLPIHARTHLRHAQAETLKQLNEYYNAILVTPKTDTKINYEELDENIVKSILKQRQLAKESAREPLGLPFNKEHFLQSLYCEREILRAITFMQNALMHIDNADALFARLPTWRLFNETITQALKIIINAITSDDTKGSHIHIPSLIPLRDELQKNVDIGSRDDLVYLDGFLFSAEILTARLAKLAALYQVAINPHEKL